MTAREVFEFDEFVLEVGERRLRRGTDVVTLAPKAHDLLVELVRQAGHLVTKRDLLDRVWPGTHVEEGILSVHVSNLRKALRGSVGADRLIETVPGAGYRFAAEVRRPAARADQYSMRWPVGVLAAQPAVHQLIGRGREHLLTSSRPEIPKAVDAFQSAIALDPSYAAAHAGLARACCAQAELRLIPHGEAYDAARTSALRALAMDDDCADAQVALGAVMFLSDWNWDGARRSLERALALDPGHTEGYLLYGRLLEALGDFDAALAAKHKALERDPSSALVQLQIALTFWNSRRYADMLEWSNRVLDQDPRHSLAREYLASAYWKLGDFDRQMDESIRHAEVNGVPLAVLTELRDIYAAGGRTAMVKYAIDRAGKSGNPVQLAVLHGELGNLDEAFFHLDRALESRDPSLVHIAVAPQWDSLRDDVRFADRLARMGLSQLDR